MHPTAAAILLLLACSSAFAHKDRIQHPTNVSVTFSADRSAVFELGANSVSAITVRLGEFTYRVPGPTCAKIADVRFESVRLLWDGRTPTAAEADYF